MLTQRALVGAAVLSGVAASLLTTPAAYASSRDEPVVVYGEADEETETVEVRFDDLDLATGRHQQRLNRRVAAAVREVCDDGDGPGIQYRDYLSCTERAWKDARPQVESAIDAARQLALAGETSVGASAIAIGTGRMSN